MAVSFDRPLKAEYQTYEPAAVFERGKTSGITGHVYCEVAFAPAVVLAELHDAYALFPEPGEKLLLSMEISCAARLESGQRATFLSLVSALERLAEEKPVGPPVDCFVDHSIQQ